MKPPPRKRSKPGQSQSTEPVPQPAGKLSCKWPQAEQMKLLNALKCLSSTDGGRADIDYTLLQKSVPTRSVSEIQSVVEFLKNKVVSCAQAQLRQMRLEEKKIRKPIQMWTCLASAVTGNLDEPISTAFSQMWIVSSTEPRTLRNCDPPQVHRPPNSADKPVGRTVPFRPMPRLSVQGKRLGITTCPPLLLKTPAPSMGPARRLQAPSQVIRVTTKKFSPPSHPQASIRQLSPRPAQAVILLQQQPPLQQQQPPLQHSATIFTTSTSNSSPPVLQTPSILSVSPSPVQGAAPSSATSSSSATSTRPTPSLPSSAAALHSRFGRTSKYATEDSPRTLGVKCVVDFERIYCYLSSINKPSDECHLTPMESAVVLDLLMSLPEELPLLDCNKLNKHLTQVYQRLLAHADSKTAREMFVDLKKQKQRTDEHRRHPAGSQDGQAAHTETNIVPDKCSESRQDGGTADGPPSAEDGSDVMENEGSKLVKEEAESQSAGSKDTSSGAGDADTTGLCPPLNPFIIPSQLLMRR